MKNLYTNFFNNLKGVIIPHAHIHYAGKAREIIFNNLNNNDKNIKYIIYLAALHNPINSNKKVFILENNKNFKSFFKNKNNYTENLTFGAKKEQFL